MCVPNKGSPSSKVGDESKLKDKAPNKVFTKHDLHAHNKPSDAWAVVHGKVLDITEFAKRHPGGEIILLAAGIDASVLFETYHPRGVNPAVVKKLQIGVMEGEELKESFYSWDSGFYNVLRKRVVKRLDDLGRPIRGCSDIMVKAIMIITGFWFCLYQMYVTASFLQACFWSCAMGAFAAFVGTCIQHDGNHGAFSKNGYINQIAGWTLDMIGASAFTWRLQHMLGHHPYTNVLDADEETEKGNGVDSALVDKDQESDPDVFSSYPFMRFHPFHKVEWYHKYQHLYAPVLYSLMTLAKVLQQDVEVATSKRLYHIDASCIYDSKFNQFRFWFMKGLSVGYMIALPCYFQGIVKGLFLFFLGHLFCGEMLATFFIVNHVIEGVAFATKSDSGAVSCNSCPVTADGITPMKETQDLMFSSNKSNVPRIPLNDWAAVQCQTSVNWSSGSWFWNHVSGGLSHQIEHHLFPSICHTNYVYIQDVVEQTCLEYGVPYQNEPSLYTAYFKMLRHLKNMGAQKEA